MNVIRVEKPVGVVVAFGGQTAIKLTKFLDENGIRILGTSAEGIDTAEDRERFDELLERFGISRPKGTGVMTKEEALDAAHRLGYPVLLRPSYVIGGQNMTITHNDHEVEVYMNRILSTGIENPVLVDKYMPGTEIEVDCISDGKDVLIPGIMQHIERAGVHSGDSIAVYPAFSLSDKMIGTVCECSEKLALSLGTKGLVNIQYLIYQNELFVIEVNPRASRTIPYISKVTGVPMVDLASKIMTGAQLKELGFGTGLYRRPPYYAVKVPVFSFEKLTDVNSYLGPEMKSTGEVLGIGRTLNEALFKGLCAAGIRLKAPTRTQSIGVLISVEDHDYYEIVGLAKKLDDMGFRIYATSGTAEVIGRLGIDVTVVAGLGESDNVYELMESGKISYIVYTGAVLDSTMDDFIALHRRAQQLSIACLTSLDTANAVADIIASRFNEGNTELVDINRMRTSRQRMHFTKMQGTGDDYIFIDNRDGSVSCPESICVNMCHRHYGIGASGVVLVCASECADIGMRVFNADGSEGRMAGNSIRCLAKYVYDNGIVKKEEMTVETPSGVKKLRLYVVGGEVSTVSVEMGKPDFNPKHLPCTVEAERILDLPTPIDGVNYNISCLSVGNPHCVLFVDRVDNVKMKRIGPMFENASIFPNRVNTEFVRVVNEYTLKMRVYERGNGETMSCGTGACAAVVTACELGYCPKGKDITVKQKGGDIIVNYAEDGTITLTGDAKLIFEGEFLY